MKNRKDFFLEDIVMTSGILILLILSLVGVISLERKVVDHMGGSFTIAGLRVTWPKLMLLLCILCVGSLLVKTIYNKHNRQLGLLSMSLNTLDESIPRIARVNFETAEYELVKDVESKDKLFRKSRWDQFCENFFKSIHPEDAEKVRTFFSIENLRRIACTKCRTDSMIYRRELHGEYKWVQTVVLSFCNQKMKDSVLVYARTVDDSGIADQLYKQNLWNSLQKIQRDGAEQQEYLKYIYSDIQTPMKALQNMSMLTQKALEEGDSEKANAWLERVDCLAEYVSTIVDDIFRSSAKKSNKPKIAQKVFSLKAMLMGVEEYYQNGYGKDEENGISFEMKVDDRIADQYVGDECHLIQVLDALLDNAYKYNKRGGKVSFAVQVVNQGEDRDELSFQIRDEGIGIDEAKKAKLFDFFVAGNHKVEEYMSGMGMGLAYIKLITEEMGGMIDVESVVGEGSCFTVSIALKRVL